MATRHGASFLRSLTADDPVRIVGVYDGLSGRLAERAGAQALWASGLCIAASQALPDGEGGAPDSLLRRLAAIRRGCDLPILVDGNSGYGNERVVARLVPVMEDLDVQGVCIEDKAYPRRNSLAEGPLALESAEAFALKVHAAATARRDPRFVVVARLEGFIVGRSAEEVLRRARLCLEAGADAIVVHSKAPVEDEVLDFARLWARRAPLIVIPTTYPTLTLSAARHAGIAGIIYANQLMRAAISAMRAFLAEAVGSQSISDCVTPLSPLAELLELTGSPVHRSGDPSPPWEAVHTRLPRRHRPSHLGAR